MIKRLDKSKALKRFGLAAILLRLITIAMHLLVICKVLPYTWVSGGQSIVGNCNDYPCANIKECFAVTNSFEPQSKEACTKDEYKIMKRAFFEKEQNPNIYKKNTQKNI